MSSQAIKNGLQNSSKIGKKAHTTAINSFNKNHSDYHLFRPSFSPKIVNKFLADLNLATEVQPNEFRFNTNKSILELAAGSGKFTKNLVDNGWNDTLTIVEPSLGMLESFKGEFPMLKAIQGSSYKIDLPDNSIDSVIVAQGFHWFSDLESLKEINRVLKTNGTFGCIWNFDFPTNSQVVGPALPKYDFVFEGIDQDTIDNALKEAESSDPFKKPYIFGNLIFQSKKWANEVTKYIYSFDVNVPQYRQGLWRQLLSKENPYFTPILKENFLYYKTLVKPTDNFKYWETRSYITDLPAEKKEEIKNNINSLVEKNITSSDMVKVDDEIFYEKIMGTHSIVLDVKK